MNNNGFNDWAVSVRSGVADALHKVVAFIPNVVGAIIVLLVGVIVAYVLKALVVRVLRAIKIKPLADRVGLGTVFPGKYDFVELLGDIVKWFFIIVFLLQALEIVNLLQVRNLVSGLLGYIPSVIAAVVLILVGGVVADLLSRVVVDMARVVGSGVAVLLGTVTRYTVWVLVIFTALAQLRINTLFLDRLFTAIVAMLALAGGLAFGLGGRDVAKDVLEDTRRRLK